MKHRPDEKRPFKLVEENLNPTNEPGVYSLYRLFKMNDAYYELNIPKLKISTLEIEEDSFTPNIGITNTGPSNQKRCVLSLEAQVCDSNKLWYVTCYERSGDKIKEE